AERDRQLVPAPTRPPRSAARAVVPALREGGGARDPEHGAPVAAGPHRDRAPRGGRLSLPASAPLLPAHPVELSPDDVVALAGGAVQPRRVEDLDHPAAVPDQAGLLQHAGRDGDGRPTNPEHLRQELLRQRELVTLE